MKILIAPDKFKGTLSAQGVCDALKKGILKSNPTFQIDTQPMADGGDGSIDLLNKFWNLKEIQVEVHDPLFRKINASYYVNESDAFIEMAKASGLALLNKNERNPMKTTSYGTGELIFDAFSKGYKNINLFIGGSATNDGGIGIANALGYEFVDENENELTPIGENLSKIFWINSDDLPAIISMLNIRIICDVDNPFYGKNGAAYVYARQKGANDLMIEKLDRGLEHLANVYGNVIKMDVNIPGAGAAGGIGGGMIALFNGQLISGSDFFIDLFKIDSKIQDVDLVISGEGGFDSQSLQGKVIGGLSKLCKKHNKPLIIVCGKNGFKSGGLGKFEIHSIANLAPTLKDSMNNPIKYLEKIGEQLDFTQQREYRY